MSRRLRSSGRQGDSPAARREGRRAALRRSLWCGLLLGTVLACRSSTEPEPHGGLTLTLDAVPLLVKAADTVEVATIWATVLEKGHPVADSTLVSFAASNGRIDAEAMTRDGLAKATFHPGSEPGVAAVIAQVRAVRDTVHLTLY
jgi:hypothetical protein